MSDAPLEIRGLCKRFAAVEALRAIDLSLPGGYVCVMGESGSGKTTLLRILAGLERADAGRITLAGAPIDHLPPERRPTRTVFQTPALFPQLSVLDNVAFAARLRREAPDEPHPEPRARAEQLLARLGLDPARYGARGPEALSGGERQRVALARALFDPPQWLLLDEPLSALDRPRRAELRRTLAAIHREHPCAILHVTHEPEEALSLADRLVVMAEGRILAVGEPAQLYARPPDLATARLLGDLTRVAAGWLRPEHLRLVARDDPGARIFARLEQQHCAGPRWECTLTLDDGATALATTTTPWVGDGDCALTWTDEDLLVLA